MNSAVLPVQARQRQEEANQEGEERPEIVFGVRLAAETKVTPVLLLLL